MNKRWALFCWTWYNIEENNGEDIAMRLFIGIKTECEDHLCSLQQALLTIGKGRLVAEDNLHLTLKFLGEVPPAEVGAIRHAMETVDASPFSLECHGAALVGKNGIAAANVGGDIAALQSLHAQLETALQTCGFAKELRRFRPHITLARQYRARPGEVVSAIPYRPCALTVREIILFESKRVDGRLGNGAPTEARLGGVFYVPLFVKKLR